jgi:hypothetical protein
MAELVPVIQSRRLSNKEGVDARPKAGHDEGIDEPRQTNVV